MPRTRLNKQLELATGPNYVGTSDATGEQQYTLFNAGDYLVTPGTDIQNKPMAYADLVAGAAPAVTATPPGAPATPANNATLTREYDDIVRVWQRTAGVWAHAFDIDRHRIFSQHLQQVPQGTVLGPGVIARPGDAFYIIPSHLNGASITKFKSACFAGLGTSSVSLIKNGVAIACYTATNTNTAVSSLVCPGVTVLENDVLSVTISTSAVNSQAGWSVTIEFTQTT